MEEIIGLLTDSNGNHAVGEGDIRDAIILIKDMYAENTAILDDNQRLRIEAEKHAEQMVKVLEAFKKEGEKRDAENAALRTIVREIERIADGAGILEDYKSAWRDAAKKLQAALDKINETGQHV